MSWVNAAKWRAFVFLATPRDAVVKGGCPAIRPFGEPLYIGPGKKKKAQD